MNASIQSFPQIMEEGVAHGNEEFLIGVHRIRPYPDNPRKIFDQESIDDLAASIQTYGQQTPIQVRRVPGDAQRPFMLVAGERRWRAGQKISPTYALRATISAITNDRDHYRFSVMENLQRENLAPIDEANSVKRLIRDDKMTVAAVAEMFTKSVSWVQDRLLLAERLSVEIHPYLDPRRKDKQLGVMAAIELAKVPYPELQLKLAQEIIAESMTVEEASHHIVRATETLGIELTRMARDPTPTDNYKLVTKFIGRTNSTARRYGSLDFEDMFYERGDTKGDAEALLGEIERAKARLDNIAKKIKQAVDPAKK